MAFMVYTEPFCRGATKHKKRIIDFPFVMMIFASYVEPLIDVFILIKDKLLN